MNEGKPLNIKCRKGLDVTETGGGTTNPGCGLGGTCLLPRW